MTRSTIPARDRLIFALDVPDRAQAIQWTDRLGDAVSFYKIGLELCMAPGFFSLLDWLRARDKKVFVDLKFFDVPQTVAAAMRQLRGRPAEFATVHGNDAILKAACEAKDRLKILAVTVLTSLDQADLASLGFRVDVEDLVLSRARRALAIGPAIG